MGLCAYIRGGNPSSSCRAPFRHKKAQSMPGPKGNTRKKRPFFALEPIIILDVVGVCKQRVQGEEGEGIQVQVPWDCGLESCPGYFW